MLIIFTFAKGNFIHPKEMKNPMRPHFKGLMLMLTIVFISACSNASASSITEKHPPTLVVKKQSEIVLFTPSIERDFITIVRNDYHQVSIVVADNPSDYFAASLAHQDMIIAPKTAKALNAPKPSPIRDRYWCSIINIRFQNRSLSPRINLPNRSHPLIV